MAEATRFRYNKEAGEYYEELKEHRFKNLNDDEKKRAKIIYTIAFAKGIATLPLDFKWESIPGEKKDVRLEVFETPITNAIIRQRFGVKELSQDFKIEVYRSAIECGLLLLKKEERVDGEQFFLSLLNHKGKVSIDGLNETATNESLDRIDIPIPDRVEPIVLRLGEDDEGNPVEINYNSKENNQFLGISGKSGSGKTQFFKELIAQLSEQAPHVSLTAFDIGKGDIAGDGEFIATTGMKVVDVYNDGLPYNPFYIGEPNREKIEELKDILISTQPSIGTAQDMRLVYLLYEIYDKFPETDAETVNRFIREKYEEEGIKPDSLSQLFHAMSVHGIFPGKDDEGLFRNLYDKHVVYDLHNIDSKMKIKELTMFFILNKLYKEARSMNEAKEDPVTGMRELRAVIVLDEAHNYLGANNTVLEKMLRELRSKGIGIIILTQGYGDYEQKKFDYSSQMNWTLLLKSDNTRNSIEKALGVPKTVSENLRESITHAPAGRVYARKFRDKDKHYTTWEAKQFYQRYIN